MSNRIRLAVGAVVLAASITAQAWSQPRLRPPASYVQPAPPDAEEGARILEASRNLGLAGPYYLEFDLLVLPRRGQDRRVAGRWFGSRNNLGPITRIELATENDANDVVIVQSGPRPAVWMGRTGGAFARAEGERAFAPLAGSNLSAADLQTPFMFWTDYVYEGLARFRGRPTHVFLLYPPEEERSAYPGVGGARVFIDTAYGALSQAQWLDDGGSPIKTMTILGLKKVDDRWIVKAFEARDERTRDKTRFVVTAAALDVRLPDDLFIPADPVQAADVRVPDEAVSRVR